MSARARRLVERRTPAAGRLGARLGRLIDDPERFVAVLEIGLGRLSDAAYRQELERISPGDTPRLGVRQPLLRTLGAGLAREVRDASPASLVSAAERLTRTEWLETRLVAHGLLRSSLPGDPERTWQVIRRLAGGARDWISVDGLAGVVGVGILADRRRWAELEQLVYSLSRWERRLVGSTVATLPRLLRPSERPRLADSPALPLIATALGDPEPDVQKALSWALRAWQSVDPEGVWRLLDVEAQRAGRERDGNRAWVIRDALGVQPAERAASVRAVMIGVRRTADSASTSAALEIAALFRGFEGPSGPRADGAEVAQRSGERMGSFAT